MGNGFSKQKKVLSVLFSCLLIVFLSSCGNTDKNDKSQGDRLNGTSIETDINTFKPIGENFIEYSFNITRNGTEERPTSFLVQGEYDLNQDGRLDTIVILLPGHYRTRTDDQGQIQVNEMSKGFYLDHTMDGEVRIIDLDANDEFLEIAIFDEGPSGDPHYKFYRYDGLNLHEMGSIDAAALIDGRGRLLSSFHVSRFEPAFYSAWYEIENNRFTQKINNIDEYLGKNYMFSGGEAYFIPTEQMPESLDIMWDDRKYFDAGELKLIDVYFYPDDRTLNFYFVEFVSGEKGILYFWIGD